MQSANHTFFELLRFPATELFRVKSSEILCVCRGSLQVIHSKPLNTFLLKIGHLKIALDKTLPVIGAFSDLEKYPAYLFPTFDGFYMIKIMDNKPNVVLNNFETILENTCMFSRREGMEEKLGDVREPTMDTKLAVLSEVYHKVKDTIAVHTFHEKHPNFTLLRTFEDLQNVDSHSVPVIDVSEDELVNTRTELEEVVRNHLSNKYWTHFSKKEGIPSDSYLKYSAFGAGVAQTKGSKIPVESLEEQRPHTDSIGADNIDTVKKEAAVENQEVVGTEDQRLPAYEVQSSKDHVEQGLDKASCRLDDAKFYQNCDLPPVPESQIKEDTAFTTDLLKPADQKDKPESNLTTPIGANGDPYRRDITQDMPLNSLANSEKWGSDVTNPSESAMKLGSELGLSDAAFSTTSENNSDVGTKPVIIGQGLTHSQSLRDTSLGNAAKENLVFKQNPSDKHEMKQKNISEEPLDKENLTTI